MIRQRSRPMPVSVARGFRSMRPNMPQVPPRNPQMGGGLAAMSPEQMIQAIQRKQAQGAPIPNAPGGGLAAMSPEQLKALQDRQAQGMAPQGVPNPDVGAALKFMRGTPIEGTPMQKMPGLSQGIPMQAKPPGLKKGGMVKKASKVSSASKRADGCSTKGKTKGRMV